MAEERTKDEIVDGPKLAAEILNRMNPDNKQKIVKAIQSSDPALASQIEEKLYDFDVITELTPQGVQVLLKEVQQHDLILALKTASAPVQEYLFANMSERKCQIVKSDFAALPQVRLVEVQEAQRRILKKLDELRASSAVRTMGKHEVWV